jgi:RNA-binding protein
VQPLSTSQRQFLRKIAHDLKPVVQIGKNGLSDKLFASVDEALDAHELIKVKFVDFQDRRRELAEELADRTGGALVALIGNIAIMYRQQPDREQRKIHLPA